MVSRSVALVPQWKWLVAALAVIGALIVAPAAQAAPASVYGGEVACGPAGEITACSGTTLSWDGTKIDVNVFLPPEADGEGPFPVIGDFHGWGGSKQGLTTIEPVKGLTIQQEDSRIQKWAQEGYAVFSMSDRGWGLSCGAGDLGKGQPNCANGYNHLMDDRYEVRDAQFLISELADEGLAQPKKIGVTGASYGGGISVAMAALRNREMLPGGQLVPWTSPEGEEMEIAAAVPQWAWTDIAYALAPNGRNLDYVTESSYRGPSGNFPIGVMKLTYTEALYQGGLLLSNYSTTNPEANIPGWRERLLGGEPYADAGVMSMIEQLTTYHSPFYINDSVEPAPLLFQSGWNDDLFPADEVLRFYQRTRATYPGDPVSLFFADYGHARSQNKKADVALFNERLEAWFAHYLKGEGSAPSSSVEALTTTCPKEAPSEGPYRASDWSGLAPGEISLHSGGTQTIHHRTFEEEKVPTPSSGAFDPILGPGNPCVAVPVAAAKNPDGIEYSLGAAPEGGFTLMGSPTIIAQVTASNPNSEIAARLVDVSPEGTESLIARGLYRPSSSTQEMVFQLHPQGYHFAAGHVAKLELLPSDALYGRPSNLQTNIAVSDLELRLPVMEQPGSLGGLVQNPAAKVVPPGYQLAAEYEQKAPSTGGNQAPAPAPPAPPKVGFGGVAGKLTANGNAILVPVRCSGDGDCSGKLSFSVKKTKGKGSTVIARGSYSLTKGTASNARLPLTKAGRNLVKSSMAAGSKKIAGVLELVDSGRQTTLNLNRAAQLPRGK
jgi:fermentation-respiration switch protein FrsA (DUF1100 family)